MIVDIRIDNLEMISKFEEMYKMASESFDTNPYAAFLVYIDDRIVVGYLYYSDIYDRIEINQISVLDNYKRQGYASEMMEHLKNKKKNISLEVKCDNIPAIKLYEKHGFKKVAIRKGYYDGVDGHLMILEMK